MGADDPLVVKQELDNYFGTDGFGDFKYQSTTDLPQPKPEHAVFILLSLINKYPSSYLFYLNHTK